MTYCTKVKNTRRLVLYFASSIVIGCACTTKVGIRPTGLEALAEYLDILGYKAYRVPRSDWGPGYVFKAEIRGQGANKRIVPILNPNQDEICGQLYPSSVITKADLDAPNVDYNGSLDIGAGLSLLKNLIGDKNKAEADLIKHHNVAQLIVKWGPLKEYKIQRDRLRNSNGDRIAVRKACFDEIQYQKENNDLDNLWVITKAVAVESMDYSFNSTNSTGLGLDVSWKDVLTINANVKTKQVRKNTLRIEAERFVGYARAKQLKEWAPKGAVSGASRHVVFSVEVEGPDLPIAEK